MGSTRHRARPTQFPEPRLVCRCATRGDRRRRGTDYGALSPGAEDLLCKTKPICRAARARHAHESVSMASTTLRTNDAKQSQFPDGLPCETNPISRRCRAKQSQFRLIRFLRTFGWRDPDDRGPVPGPLAFFAFRQQHGSRVPATAIDSEGQPQRFSCYWPKATNAGGLGAVPPRGMQADWYIPQNQARSLRGRDEKVRKNRMSPNSSSGARGVPVRASRETPYGVTTNRAFRAKQSQFGGPGSRPGNTL